MRPDDKKAAAGADTAALRPTDPEASARYCRLEQIDPGLWRRLEGLVAERPRLPAGVVELEPGRSLAFSWFNRRVVIEPAARFLRYLDEPPLPSPAGPLPPAGAEPGYQEGLVILTLLDYLLSGSGRLPEPGGLVNEHHLPGGTTFFRGPHVMASVLIANRYARNGAGFLAAGRAWGGRQVSYGEFGLSFTLFPGLDWIVALWEADEEFSARAQYLFDKNLGEMFRLDVIWAIGNLMAAKLAPS